MVLLRTSSRLCVDCVEHPSTLYITIDGVLDEQVWNEVPWSETFQDIRGPQFWSQPWFTTKIKLRYDDRFLYIGVYLEETEVWANVSKRNDVVFHDNDFEVFVDADGSTHNYKEFEINTRNVTWNLWLNRPYRDGGHENSSRVDPEHGFDMLGSGMRSAVYMKGRQGDPSERLHFWTAEIALPLAQLALHSKATVPPVANSHWRINFSRVEWPVRVVTDSSGKQHYVKELGLNEENWVWSSQYAVDMHRPEWWGYLQFRPQRKTPPRSTDTNEIVPLDLEWGVRYVSFQFYYAQHDFHKTMGEYALTMDKLRSFFSSPEAFQCSVLFDIHATKESFHARIGLKNDTSDNMDADGFVATIEDDGHIVVEKMHRTSAVAAIK
ncbi:hypothetical protein BBO99_00002015 [Phytophthora kernoviae]|uniref:Carbohydrate-binding domain-containing protein n=2 Tax=Phytophthora kernoviae TaxID=325452 RepID=A0A3R7I2D7_9STRA|nr:hypothetical protein G195_000854 [Phytophthora kernoviae 00238/432]KAG2532835.1 hypothetical protein JM16_000020 [Phytophthora kernoviae]KAG2533566.1 hypothetical protein JM18_000021 [Phytophthora kernoviae]RLN11035.1 hypothetical protein BBI17_000198 [Phytophthora kernoviae]RLN86172.1 hypothetical protein BBO99_00002015 [Phytophthora kernoviae]